MIRLLIPIGGLVVSTGFLLGWVFTRQQSLPENGPRSLGVLLSAVAILTVLFLLLSIWSHRDHLRLAALRAAHPGERFHNVLLDSGSLQRLYLGEDEESTVPTDELRFTLSVGKTGIRLWRGGRSPVLVLERSQKSLGSFRVEVIPGALRESPTLHVALPSGSSIYVQPMGPFGGVFPSSILAAISLRDEFDAMLTRN